MTTIKQSADLKNNIGFLAVTAAFIIVTAMSCWAMSNASLAQLPLGSIQQLLLLVFVIWHGLRRYGPKSLTIFFLVSQVVSHGMENLSILTGIPFGNYHYTEGLLFLFQVPILIGIAYFTYGYLAWTIANILLGRVDERLKSWAHTIVLPLTASFIMVMWDVVMDPVNSTIKHFWIWEDGGGFNGVPLSNYLGWFLTVYLFYQTFALYLHRHSSGIQSRASKVFWITPVIFYLVTALSYVLIYIFVSNGIIIDATGQAWERRSIYETAAIVSLYTMTFPAFLAIVKVLRPERKII